MRTVFVLTSGFLGRINGETRCSFWVDEPVDHGFDSAKPAAPPSGRAGQRCV